jgi:alpha-amylase/alpha-mannosidase (GH57 family)
LIYLCLSVVTIFLDSTNLSGILLPEMKKIYLAFLWHHHQPYYRPDVHRGEFQMPWVRLHGIKDYYGMASLISQYPKIKTNINLVPSLLKQIKEYLSGTQDRLLLFTTKPAPDLTSADKQYILENTFLAHPQHMIGTCPRYKELYSKIRDERAKMKEEREKVVARFSEQDFIDLLVCSSLVWFHPLIKENDAEIKQLMQKGRNYTEEDKTLIAQKQMDYLSKIIPLHKRLQDTGQIEITTSAFYHPILPLLCNMQSARQAIPDVKLPEVDQAGLFEDALNQIASAVEFYTEHFGKKPSGFWPSEGAVSDDILPLLAENGINYLATDEEILSATLKRPLTPDDLYQPYKLQIPNILSILFRDQELSNLISFQYKRWNPKDAVEHFISLVKSKAGQGSHPAPLVSVILDGENPWEHYPNNGIEFLRLLYERLEKDDSIETVRFTDYLARYPVEKRLNNIFAGSWINHNFAIWVGHREDCQGWEYLARTREIIKQHRAKDVEDAVISNAKECLYIAEGSDWFWWFGHEHSSSLDDQFDYLFRSHLMNVYHLLGLNPPDYLYRPIKIPVGKDKELYSQPCGLLDIKLDGRRSDYFEWLPAGHFNIPETEMVRTTMNHSSPSSAGLISDVFFGFDKNKNLCLRLDIPGLTCQGKTIPMVLGTDDIYFILNFLTPIKRKIIIPNHSPRNNRPENNRDSGTAAPLGPVSPQKELGLDILDETDTLLKTLDSIAIDEIIEVLCPLELLVVKENPESFGTIEFFVEVYQDTKFLSRYPDNQPIILSVKTEETEYLDWSV